MEATHNKKMQGSHLSTYGTDNVPDTCMYFKIQVIQHFVHLSHISRMPGQVYAGQPYRREYVGEAGG
jgi:hypothetical protein